MNTTKTLTLLISGLAGMILLLLLIRLLLRKLRHEADAESKIKAAYGIYLAGLLIAGTKVLSTVLSKIAEVSDILTNTERTVPYTELIRLSVLLIGFGIAWFLLWLLISRVFMGIMTGVKKETDEMILNNTHYFLVKAVLLICLVWLLDPLLLQWLKIFMPSISVPFYH